MHSVDVLVVGGGQAGLATAAWLGRLAPSLSCQVLEAHDHLGTSWESRWDSLRLFTPRRFSALPGLTFPDGPGECPTRLEMAAYLRAYAAAFALPVVLSRPVTRLVKNNLGFLVNGELQARHVVVASGPFLEALVPAVAADLGVRQLHSSAYRRPTDLPAGKVVVVGGGDSAAQIALELSSDRPVTLLAGGEPWYLPTHVAGVSTYTWLRASGVLSASADGPVVRAVRRRGEAIFGTELRTAVKAGRIRLLPRRVVGAESEALRLDDGSTLAVSTVLWCTGFRASYPWLDVSGALNENRQPIHTCGASPVHGLHWMGLPWQRRLDSSIVHGAGPDARATVMRIMA